MPRENIHWVVLDRALERSSERIRKIGASFQSYGRLGAVTHDAPYFLKGGHHPFGEVAEKLHGTDGDDTLRPFKILIPQVRLSEPTIALLLGMLSHIATDSVFHPLIYFYTGDYYSSSDRVAIRKRHRLLETYLDEQARVSLPECKQYRGVGDYFNSVRADSSYKALLSALTTLSEEIFDVPSHWEAALKEMSLGQRIFHSLPVGFLVRLAALFPGELQAIDALFRFGRRNPGLDLTKRWRYRNPVTNIECEHSINELLELAITLTAVYFESVFTFLDGQTAALFEGLESPSLNFGIPNTRREDGKYFSDVGFPLPGLGR